VATRSEKLRYDGADLAVEREGEQNVVEESIQVPIGLLRTGDDLKKLIELFATRRISLALFEAAHETA